MEYPKIAPAFQEGERALSWDHLAYKGSKQVRQIPLRGGRGQAIKKNLKRGAQVGRRKRDNTNTGLRTRAVTDGRIKVESWNE